MSSSILDSRSVLCKCSVRRPGCFCVCQGVAAASDATERMGKDTLALKKNIFPRPAVTKEDGNGNTRNYIVLRFSTAERANVCAVCRGPIFFWRFQYD